MGNPRRKNRGHTFLWGKGDSWVWSCQVECWLWAGRGGTRLSEAIGAVTEEFEEAEVAEDLELLADFVADMGVVGVKFG